MHITEFCNCLRQIIDMYEEQAQEELPSGLYEWNMKLKIVNSTKIMRLKTSIKQLVKGVHNE